MSTLACSGSCNPSATAGASKAAKHGEKRMTENAMRETRFGIGNWFLRQDSEESHTGADRGTRRPLTGRVSVPAGLALAMAMSVKGQKMDLKMGQRSLSGSTLVDEEREVKPTTGSPNQNRWLVLC